MTENFIEDDISTTIRELVFVAECVLDEFDVLLIFRFYQFQLILLPHDVGPRCLNYLNS